jgi:hypothetical protein
MVKICVISRKKAFADQREKRDGVRTSLPSVGILFVSQIRFKDRFQHDDRGHLCHPILDSRYSKRPRLPIRFRDIDPPHRLRSVGLGSQFLHQLFQPSFNAFVLDPRKTLPVDSGTPTVGAAAAPGPHQHVFTMNLVIQRVKAICRICLRFGIQRSLQLPNAFWS